VSISSRELNLAWFAAVAVVLALTYFFGESKLAAWREVAKESGTYGSRILVAQRMLDQRDEWNQRLDQHRAELPLHPLDKDVTTELIKTIERMAQENGLVLLRRDSDPERSVGSLYEVAINCTWEGTLEQLIGFLYAVQIKGAILDIQQLQVTPVSGHPGRLKGSFTVDCAYTRGAAGS
jgi:Tfp pilus assembly protein PilO